MLTATGKRPWTFYALAGFFALYVAFLYGPMLCIFILSFQGQGGALVFPMRGFGLYWFVDLFTQVRTGDVLGAISRSIPLALIVMTLTVVISVASGLAFRNRFRGSGILFYGAIASLVAPGLVLSNGIGLMFQLLGLPQHWYSSAVGAQLTSTLPFGLLIMFAVFGRFNRAYEEAARDLGAAPALILRLVVVPIILPGIIAVALFGFTLSYDEFARTLQTSGPTNTLPLEIWSMTTNVTSPALYALGTVTTAFSFIVIAISLTAIALIQRRRFGRMPATKPSVAADGGAAGG
jgi:putative spermidine/putrescine transport system permease protein